MKLSGMPKIFEASLIFLPRKTLYEITPPTEIRETKAKITWIDELS